MEPSARWIFRGLIRRDFIFLFVLGTLSVSASALSPDGNSFYFIRDLTGQYRGEHHHGAHEHHESHVQAGATSSGGVAQPSGFASAAANSQAGVPIPIALTTPAYVDSFAHILPCVPIEACGRYYGQDPTDVANFGVIGPCPALGTVRCINYGPVAALSGYHYLDLGSGGLPLPAGAAFTSAQSSASGQPLTFVGSTVLNHYDYSNSPAGVLVAPSAVQTDAASSSAHAASQAQSSPSAGTASASAQSGQAGSGQPLTFVGSGVSTQFGYPTAGAAPSVVQTDAASLTSFGSSSANAAAQAQSSASASANAQPNFVEVAGAQSSIFEPHCLCVVRGGCTGRESLTLATRDKSHLKCGGDYELCCFEDPWPGVVDTFAHILPCAPIEVCGRYYGQEATDVAQYGVLGPCPGLGTVRCINPGFALHENSLGHQSLAQTVEIEVPKVQAAAQAQAEAKADPIPPPTTYAAPPPTVYIQYVPVPAPVAPVAPVVHTTYEAPEPVPVAPVVGPPVIAHPVPAAVVPEPALPVAPVPAAPLLANPGPPYLWNSLGGYRGGYSFLWPNFNVRKHFSFGLLG